MQGAWIGLAGALAAPFAIVSTAGQPPPAAPAGAGTEPGAAGPGSPAFERHEQIGVASWYGRWHHGRRTASGRIFDMHGLTAAHRTLPLGSRIHVTDVDTGRSVEVTVNDRGPYVKGRILDLSYAAARRLSAVERGVIRVRLRVVPREPTRAGPRRAGAAPGRFASYERPAPDDRP